MGVTSDSDCARILKVFLVWYKKKCDEESGHIEDWDDAKRTINSIYKAEGYNDWHLKLDSDEDDEEEDPPNPLPCYVPHKPEISTKSALSEEEEIRTFDSEKTGAVIVYEQMDEKDRNVGSVPENPIVLRFDCRVGLDECVGNSSGITYSSEDNKTWFITLDISSLPNELREKIEDGQFYFKILPPVNGTRGIT